MSTILLVAASIVVFVAPAVVTRVYSLQELLWWPSMIVVAINISIHLCLAGICITTDADNHVAITGRCGEIMLDQRVWYIVFFVGAQRYSPLQTYCSLTLYELALHVYLRLSMANTAEETSRERGQAIFSTVLSVPLVLVMYSRSDLLHRRLFYRTNQVTIFSAKDKFSKADTSAAVDTNNIDNQGDMGRKMENITNARVARRRSSVRISNSSVREINWSELQVSYKIAVTAHSTVLKAKWEGQNYAVKKIEVATIEVSFMEALINDLTKISTLRHQNICLHVAVCLQPPNICIGKSSATSLLVHTNTLASQTVSTHEVSRTFQQHQQYTHLFNGNIWKRLMYSVRVNAQGKSNHGTPRKA
jgi:hypothetical protein